MSIDPRPLADRFEEQVQAEPNSGCWLWAGRLNEHGYGTTTVTHRTGVYRSWYAHRVAWLLHRGPIPKGLCVLHRCDNRACVNPDHLWLGTRRDNQRDMVKKGRSMEGSGKMPYGVESARSGRYKSAIYSNGRKKYLGTFDTVEEAARVARAEKERLYSPAPLRPPAKVSPPRGETTPSSER